MHGSVVRRLGCLLFGWCMLALAVPGMLVQAQAQAQTGGGAPTLLRIDDGTGQTTTTGPVRLRPIRPGALGTAPADNSSRQPGEAMPSARILLAVPERPLDEFERYVSALVGPGPTGEPQQIRRLGSHLQGQDLLEEGGEGASQALVPADYLVQPGDEIVIALWGAVDADMTLRVDRSGRITMPRVGSVVVAGARFSDLQELIRRRVALTFKNFELSVTMGQLRAVRVYVTGFVNKPGVYTLTSLSTISQALIRAGGPAASGSFRDISLRRVGKPVATFDMYDVLVKGERRSDAMLQPEDVVHVGPVGPQVAMIGSVNRPAVFEIRAGETVRQLIDMAGGLSPVADSRRLTLERLEQRDELRVVELALPDGASRSMAQGDVFRAISAVAANGSQLTKNKRITVEGEVTKPGTYVLPPNSTLRDAVAAAGGLTSVAYLFATELTRESVRLRQQENYDRALRDVEAEFARAAASQRANSSEEAAAQGARASTSARLIDRLRALRPTGRVVLELQPQSSTLPDLLLEEGDRLVVPTRSSSVGVFGSVFSSGNYLYADGRTLGDYLRLAGGPTRSADSSSVFVIRANGIVISGRQQNTGWFSPDRLAAEKALPGDTVFVPEEVNKTTFIQHAKDWTQILYQMGLGVAAFKSLSN